MKHNQAIVLNEIERLAKLPGYNDKVTGRAYATITDEAVGKPRMQDIYVSKAKDAMVMTNIRGDVVSTLGNAKGVEQIKQQIQRDRAAQLQAQQDRAQSLNQGPSL